jgi:hypothetical protein
VGGALGDLGEGEAEDAQGGEGIGLRVHRTP